MADGGLTLERFEALEREVERLRRLVDPRAADDDQLLDVLSGAVKPGEEFRAGELCDAASLPENLDLRDAIAAVAPTGRWQGKKLGVALARLQGRRVGDFVLRRLGDDRESARWAFVREPRE